MVTTEILGRVDPIHSNGHRAGELTTVSLGAEAGIKVPPEAFLIPSSLQEQIFAQNPDIKERIERLDQVSERWMNAKLSRSNDAAFTWETQAGAAGEMLREIIEDVALPSSIGEMYDKLFQNVGTVAVQNSGQNEIFLQQGEKGVLDPIKKFLAFRFAKEAVSRRNEARLEMLQETLRDNPQDIDRAWQKSELLSHAKSNLPIVVQRWHMRSSQK